MASQRMIVAKIAGEAAVSLFDRFRNFNLQGARLRGNRDSRTCDELQHFVSGLRAHSDCPPVLFYAEYVDMWSMGDVFTRPFAGFNRRRFLHVEDGIELMVYRLPDKGRLERTIRAALRPKRVRSAQWQETRLFLTILLESVLSWEEIKGKSALVVVRDVHGSLVLDEDVIRSMKHVPEWIGS
jgi:hypothetical protein